MFSVKVMNYRITGDFRVPFRPDDVASFPLAFVSCFESLENS